MAFITWVRYHNLAKRAGDSIKKYGKFQKMNGRFLERVGRFHINCTGDSIKFLPEIPRKRAGDSTTFKSPEIPR
jgi:hypothetical protein